MICFPTPCSGATASLAKLKMVGRSVNVCNTQDSGSVGKKNKKKKSFYLVKVPFSRCLWLPGGPFHLPAPHGSLCSQRVPPHHRHCLCLLVLLLAEAGEHAGEGVPGNHHPPHHLLSEGDFGKVDVRMYLFCMFKAHGLFPPTAPFRRCHTSK